MIIRRIDGATRVLGDKQGYLGLPLRDELIECSVGGPSTPAMLTAWQPTLEDLAVLLNGGCIYLRVLGSAHPPVMLEVGPAPSDGAAAF